MEGLVIEAKVPDEQLHRVLMQYIVNNEEEEILLSPAASKFLSICEDTLHKKSNKGEIPYWTFKGVRPKLFLKSQLKKYKEQNQK
ncbi:hypothetical protein ACMGDK_11200 [Chryseobacterium sp. DT-3]|uniref:hypothetical protein n=1 Tax=Chryseobacterium sp. DT-3 TaxID=3396164 RepID=UPI003F195ED2